jgi:hypothetical protein
MNHLLGPDDPTDTGALGELDERLAQPLFGERWRQIMERD